jgi:hypothetical protein
MLLSLSTGVADALHQLLVGRAGGSGQGGGGVAQVVEAQPIQPQPLDGGTPGPRLRWLRLTWVPTELANTSPSGPGGA